MEKKLACLKAGLIGGRRSEKRSVSRNESTTTNIKNNHP
jgi:hypothetical protein